MKLRNVFCLILAVYILQSCAGNSDGFAPSSDLASTIPVPGVAPNAVTIVDPLLLSAVTNTSLNISGVCQIGATVNLTGADTQSTSCPAGTFAFVISKAVSGNYFFSIDQVNASGASPVITVSWTLDLQNPAQIVITSPLANPYTSGDNSINVTGSCETGAAVNVSGAHSASTTCVASSFTFSGITQTVDGSYDFTFIQTDLAGNISTPRSFTWVRDTLTPPTPTITNFTDNPHYTNASPLTISGGCVTGNTVYVSENGSVLNSFVCAGSAYSLNVAKGANGSYSLSVYQTEPTGPTDSAYRDFVWVYDSVAPSAPVITNPTSPTSITSSGNLIISGLCEVNAQVNLSGDDIQGPQNCGSGSFSFTISEAVDGLYNYSVTQTDLAGNTSAADTQQWTRDSSALPLPTINSPAIDPYVSNLSTLSLTGTCETGLTVTLAGVLAGDVTAPAGSLTQVCSNSSYSYLISKVDGTYNLLITQTNGVLTSAAAARTWIVDTQEPSTTLSSFPPATNYSLIAQFVFSVSDNRPSPTAECRIDGGAYATCTSPLIYFDQLSNGSHTLDIRGVDATGNVESSPVSYTWTQEAHRTVALYHFDSVAPLLDSSNYTGGASNTLTDIGTALLGSAKFAEGRTANSTAKYLTVADTPSQQVLTSYMTLEGWVNLLALPGGNTTIPVVSKINGGTQSFEYGIKKQGANYYIYFKGSLNGTSNTEKKSTSFSAGEITALTSGFNHIVATWNLGTVKFYLNGVAKGSAVIGTAGTSKLAASAAPMRLTYNGSTTLNANIDEIRISQFIRWNAAFTPSGSAYTAD